MFHPPCLPSPCRGQALRVDLRIPWGLEASGNVATPANTVAWLRFSLRCIFSLFPKFDQNDLLMFTGTDLLTFSSSLTLHSGTSCEMQVHLHQNHLVILEHSINFGHFHSNVSKVAK